jgi:hypothetical protein
MDSKADFFGVEPLTNFHVRAGNDVNPGGLLMSSGPLVSRLSVVTAYIAIALVGAIVFGVL